MRTAVYNRYWSTGGGGEKYGGVIAEILSGDGPVHLLSHDAIDLDWLADRLHLDLSKVEARVLDDDGESVSRASADYDLFVNVSHMSSDRAASPRSLYVVLFPAQLDGHLPHYQRFIASRMKRHFGTYGASMEWGTGFHHRDGGVRGVAWTNGEASLRFTTTPGRPLAVLLVFGHHRPRSLGVAPIRVQVDGETVSEVALAPPKSRVDSRRGVAVRVDVESPAPGVPVEVRIVSDTFVPADVTGTSDRRQLGVPLRAIYVCPPRLIRFARWAPVVSAAPLSSDWMRSYGAMVSISEFTREWVERYWGCESTVLYPPVTMHKAGEKEPIILSVGRFFDVTHGHSKKQLELVRAFRQLHDAGAGDWSLHLVGGCGPDGRSYVERVRRAAEGYPIQLHLDAEGQELESLYARASVYWHAAGFGEDAAKNPARLEHFGITTVEAMSAGAVPVVVGLAGQLETVRHGVDGFHFQTLAGLCSQTLSLMADDALRDRMASSAVQRAQSFSIDAFQSGLRRIVDGLRASPPTPIAELQRGHR
jgi:glycosyltransferase involved in cell wall biosynthesis